MYVPVHLCSKVKDFRLTSFKRYPKTDIFEPVPGVFSTAFLYTSERFLSVWRSSHRRCSGIKGVLRNFTKFTGKHLCQSFFFNEVAGAESGNFIEKENLAQVFSSEFDEISKNTSRRLLLYM